MADTTAQKKHFRIAKLKLPTLAAENIKSQLQQLTHGDSRPIHFDLGFEIRKAPTLRAALLSNEFFRNLGSSGTQQFSMQLKRLGFIPDNPLNMFTEVFSEIKQGPNNIKFKAACEIPSLPDIYSTKESKAACDMPLLPNNNVKMLTDAASYKNGPTSGFNSLFNNIKRK
ncbi:uncharacterized protein LOC130738023 [Lotus japonicus]|uniref:uncharacterized protein LOC130738023 n=1 Tax=Lotus japonicus TaxID=34305 RepID=UPI00258948AD|nr:uncharacterized protein LOC130738023 [Lotus japonicus]XP_057445890.1 uncharacterized protein LOC130738023 [Lotus japonicus]